MQALRSFWAKSLPNKLSLIVLVPGLCCMLFICVARPGGNSTVVIAVTATPVPPTAGPSPTSEPTLTPGPTDTPEPTAIPEPSATPEPPPATPDGAVAAAQAYAQVVATQGGKLGDALTRIGELLQNPQLTDDAWVVNLAFQTVVVEDAHAVLSKTEPPADATELHAAILNATSDCDASMKLMRPAIDSRNAEQLNEASQLLVSCSTKLTESRPLLDVFVAKYR